MQIVFSRFALLDLEDAYFWYESERSGLGSDFSNHVQKALDHIRHMPYAATSINKRLRRKTLGRFPYGIVYRVEHDIISVEAIMHEKRDPNAWQQRVYH